MTPIFLDYETFWSSDHSLTKMPAMEYVMHPETEIISVSFKVGGGPVQVVFGEEEVKNALRSLPWSSCMAVGHNMSGFDCLLLKWRCGIEPKMWGCTAAMARSKYAKVCGVSLKALSTHLGIGEKGSIEATNTKGKHLKDFTESEVLQMAGYNMKDTELCAKLFAKLYAELPREELLLIDMTTRMLVDPVFELDEPLITRTQHEVAAEKQRALIDLHDKLHELDPDAALEEDPEEAVRHQLSSSARFSQLLEKLGVEVPMKASPTNPQKMIPAISKTDDGMQELLAHPDPLVAEAARCRLQVKSTLLETRLEAFKRAAACAHGKVPVPLRYAGADTTGRWSGEHYNPQNLPRIPRDKDGNIILKPTNALRMSLRAPKGHKVIVADQSGIELRVNMFLWKVPYAMQLFRDDPAKADLYRYFAAHHLFDCAESEVTKDQRQVGKVSHLGLGFGAGGATFQRVARTMAGLNLPLDEAERTVGIYREAHPEIKDGWYAFQNALPSIFNGHERAIDPWGMCVTEEFAVRLPSGRRIHYPSLRQERVNGKSEWQYGEGRHKARIYGPKGVENCIAEGTKVLTARGWVPIEAIRTGDMVHDGVEFVQHGGLVYKSVQPCVTIDGVRMTADHEVLTDEGWIAASQSPEPYRPDLRHVDRAVRGGVDPAPVAYESVFDIVNCGPRQRFVVMGQQGPFIVHNCVQALARDVIASNAVEFYKMTGLRAALMVHDELAYVVPDRYADEMLALLQKVMRTPVKWWPELVTWSEGDVAQSYGEAK